MLTFAVLLRIERRIEELCYLTNLNGHDVRQGGLSALVFPQVRRFKYFSDLIQEMRRLTGRNRQEQVLWR